MENIICKKCKTPIDAGTAEKNDGLCDNCSAEYDDYVLDLSIGRTFGLPDWPFFFECKQIGWDFHIAPDNVSDDVVEIEEYDEFDDDYPMLE